MTITGSTIMLVTEICHQHLLSPKFGVNSYQRHHNHHYLIVILLSCESLLWILFGINCSNDFSACSVIIMYLSKFKYKLGSTDQTRLVQDDGPWFPATTLVHCRDDPKGFFWKVLAAWWSFGPNFHFQA